MKKPTCHFWVLNHKLTIKQGAGGMSIRASRLHVPDAEDTLIPQAVPVSETAQQEPKPLSTKATQPATHVHPQKQSSFTTQLPPTKPQSPSLNQDKTHAITPSSQDSHPDQKVQPPPQQPAESSENQDMELFRKAMTLKKN